MGRVLNPALLRPATRGALLAVLASPGCARPEPSVALDLTRRALVAELTTPWDVLQLGTPQAESRQAGGLRPEPVAQTADAAAAALGEAEILLRWPRPAPRVAVLDLASLPGLADQAVRVLLNDVLVGRVQLREGRRRQRIELPSLAQRPRANRLRLSFEKTGPQGRAALLHALVVGAADDPRLGALAAESALPALSVSSGRGVPQIVQVAPSVLRFAFMAPERAELRFAPELRSSPGDTPVTFEVAIEGAAHRNTPLWRHTLSLRSTPPGEVRLPLGVDAGAAVRVSLRLLTDGLAWGAWRAPRVLGEGSADLLAPAPPAPEWDRNSGDLRRALAGCNVLFVILDAAAARRFSVYGYSRKTTPEIDRIAAEGVVFERAYTPAVYTRAAMASAWTSRYPDEGMSRDDLRLPAGRLTLAELLEANAVETVGWVANPNAGVAAGLERGFGEFHGVYTQVGRPGGAVRADALAQRFVSWLTSPRRRRFFAYVHFREPHFPYDPPPPFDTLFGPDGPLPRHAREDKSWTIRVSQGRSQATADELDHLRRLYDGNLAFADAQLGALRRALEATGTWERTVVIVSADHGEELFEHGFIGHNEQLYQETTWIPLVMRFPKGAGPAGARVNALVDLLDVAPTIGDVFAVPGQWGAGQAFQGRSLLPVALGAPGKPATVSRSIMKRPSYALTDGRFKLIYDIRRDAHELFDLARDPGELDDLGQRDPLRLAAFREALYRFILDRAGGGESAAPPLSPEELEQLKALGYIN